MFAKRRKCVERTRGHQYSIETIGRPSHGYFAKLNTSTHLKQFIQLNHFSFSRMRMPNEILGIERERERETKQKLPKNEFYYIRAACRIAAAHTLVHQFHTCAYNYYEMAKYTEHASIWVFISARLRSAATLPRSHWKSRSRATDTFHMTTALWPKHNFSFEGLWLVRQQRQRQPWCGQISPRVHSGPTVCVRVLKRSGREE